MGMLSTLRKWTPNLSFVDAPIRVLTKKNVHFMWDSQLETCLNELRDQVKKLVPLEPFDIKYDSLIFTDTYTNCVGFILVQMSPSSKISIIAAGSTGLKPPQTRYPVFDLELSAIVYDIKKLQDYVAEGLRFTIFTDHCALDKFEQTDIANVASCCTMRALEFILLHNKCHPHIYSTFYCISEVRPKQ